jgi:hypothetical protein
MKDYTTYIPSGTNIVTYVQSFMTVPGNFIGGGGSGLAISPTGTYLEIRRTGY